ncbi:MAG: YbaB/EbfC family nucleoid-associated protein [Bacteroidia bacterium]
MFGDFNLEEMLGRVRDMQDKMQDAKANLERLVVDAEAGGGMVRVKMNGNRKVLDLQIEAELVAQNDVEMLQDLLVTALNRAVEKVDIQAQDMVKKAAGDLPSLPGMDLFGK